MHRRSTTANVALAIATLGLACERSVPPKDPAPAATVMVPGEPDLPTAADASSPPPASARTPDDPARRGYFAGQWEGTYHGTQAFSTLDVFSGGRFRGQIVTGPDERCGVEGELWTEGGHLIMEFSSNDCDARGDPLIRRKLVYAEPDEFRTVDPEYAHAVVDLADGGVSGPVWTYRRKR